MASAWGAVIAALLACANAAPQEVCADLWTSSSVVALGSNVTATCSVRDRCSLSVGGAVHIEWHLDGRPLPESDAVATHEGKTSTVSIAAFNETRALLTCCVRASPCQAVAGAVLTAGYPPEPPQNLSCETRLSSPSTLSCRWAPGRRDPHLATRYTLHTHTWDEDESHCYEPPAGIHLVSIPRSHFFLFVVMKIWVEASNALGEASSAPLALDPIQAAKLEPPELQRVLVEPGRLGCLLLHWAPAPQQTWVPTRGLELEARLRTPESPHWSQQPIPQTRVRVTRPVPVCRLLHGSEYQVQLRVRYKQSPWSSWSRSRAGFTLETAPTGRLDSWMKVSKKNPLNVDLFWKPSKQFRANGRNVSYVVLPRSPAGGLGAGRAPAPLCSTTGLSCSFQLPRRSRSVMLLAVNSAGRSSPTQVPVLQNKARNATWHLAVLPQNDSSLLVRWDTSTDPGLSGFVVEWRPLLDPDPRLFRFELAGQNQTSTSISGRFEPFRPYEVSLYPRFKDGIGLPQTVQAYSRQKAPSTVPTIRIKETWHSHMELTWDEVPVEQRNGIVRRYTVFYWDDPEHVHAVVAEDGRRRVVLRSLTTLLLYKAFMMVSTDGGSLNGTAVTFKTEPVDATVVVLVLIYSGVAVSLMVIICFLTCFGRHKRFKVFWCPMIPDPANSSVKSWTSDSLPDLPAVCDVPEPGTVHLSHLSLLEPHQKPLRGPDSDQGSTSDLGESICGSPQTTPGSSPGTFNAAESVSYATVVFSGPYASQPHAYLRSDSTQPLLEAESPCEERGYQNMPPGGDHMTLQHFVFDQCHDAEGEEEEEEEEEEENNNKTPWDDFPLLRALVITDGQN